MDVESRRSISRRPCTRVRQNVALALVYTTVVIPAALHGVLNPLLAMVAIVTSTLLLVGTLFAHSRGRLTQRVRLV